MKRSIMSLLLLSISSLAFGEGEVVQQPSTQPSQNGQVNGGQIVQQTGRTKLVQDCYVLFQKIKMSGNETGQKYQIDPDEKLKCETMEAVASGIAAKEYDAVPEAFQTSDGKAICKRMAGYTVDYESCESTAKVYNALLVAATVVEQQAAVRAQMGQNKIADSANAKAASGDFQGASLEASKSNSSLMKQLNQEKVVAYTTAVAALGAKIAGWVDDAEDACKKNKLEGCLEKVAKLEKAAGAEVFANKSQKAVFIQALAEYTAKGIAAGIEASKYKSSEEAVAKIQESYEDEQIDVQLDKCVLDPMAKECLGPGQRVSGQTASIGSGEFSLGGSGSNSFDLGTGTDEFGEMGEAANIESQQVAAINSPFVDEAKEANDILDKAAAASPGSGGGAAGGGGGGGGGMGGRGSASLGNDTQTPDASGDKEAEIKSKKSSGNYAAGGGSGFSAVKASKDDSNPFASLFDQKGSAGGLEEDRTIASEGIDKKSSVLFQKISKKYSEMHSSKRIQANNLELE